MDEDIEKIGKEVIKEESFLEKYGIFIVIGVGLLWYFGYLTSLQVLGLVIAVVIYFIVMKVQKKFFNEGGISYKPLNLVQEIPKIRDEIKELIEPMGYKIIDVKRTTGNPSVGMGAYRPTTQDYLFIIQDRKGKNLYLLVKQSIIFGNIIAFDIDYDAVSKKRINWNKELMYPNAKFEEHSIIEKPIIKYKKDNGDEEDE